MDGFAEKEREYKNQEFATGDFPLEETEESPKYRLTRHTTGDHGECSGRAASCVQVSWVLFLKIAVP